MRLTQDEIYRQGLEALRDRLGRAGMIRFLQQFETGMGDYASQRRAWVDQMSLQNLATRAGQKSRRKKKRGH
jgi:hypothetical protein